MQRVDGMLAGWEWVWEGRHLPGWPGCIDMCILRPLLLVQVDGKQHFVGDRCWEPGRAGQLACDWRCGALACRPRAEGGRPMLRLHHEDMGGLGRGLLQWVLALLEERGSDAPLLVLSKTFVRERVRGQEGGEEGYVWALARWLGAKASWEASAGGAWVLTL